METIRSGRIRDGEPRGCDRGGHGPERRGRRRGGRVCLVVLAATLPSALAVMTAKGDDSTGYLPGPEHGLHYKEPAGTWDEALPLGNGIMGALVWGDGRPLKVSLDRTDLWDLRPVPEYYLPEYNYRTMQEWHRQGRHEDLVRMYEAPYSRAESPTKIPAGRIELTLAGEPVFAEARLTLDDARASVHFADEHSVEVFLHAEEAVGLIRARAAKGIEPRLIAPPFGGKGQPGEGSLAKLGYPPPVETAGPDWQAFTQQGVEGFHFAVYLAWRQSQGEWLAAWSVASSFEGEAPLDIARVRVERALQAGFDAMLASHRAWWNAYWRQSVVRVPNPVVERQWYLDQYKFGAASRRGSPPITLQGPWTADNGEIPPWKGDYHHDLNTQLSYWPCYSGNHLEEGQSFLDWLWDTRGNCIAWTKRFFELPGLNVPMTCDLNNHQMGGWRQYTHSITTAAWLAHHFDLHWRYSADRTFLCERAYPYLRDAAVFIEAASAERGPDGKRTIPLSSSPEIHDNRPEAWFSAITNYDLALMRWLMQATAEMADELGLADEARHWRQVLGEMPELALAEDGRLLVATGHPLKESHRHFSHLMAIHPLGLIDWDDGEPAQRTIRAALAELDRLGPDYWCGYSYAWLANLAARARDGQRAERALEIFATAFCLRNSFHCNGDQSGKGYSRFTYRPFTLEGNFAAAAGLQEMLLQSHRGVIRVFPAVPDQWREVSFNTLRAQGAFLVSAQRSEGQTRWVEIRAEQVGVCRVVSPFTGETLALSFQAGQTRRLTAEVAEP